jgi:hypothetical protein
LFGVVVSSGGGGYERFSNLEDLMIRSFHIKFISNLIHGPSSSFMTRESAL